MIPDARMIPDAWLHPPTLKHATTVQRELAARVVREDALEPIARVGGSDISANIRARAARMHAAIPVLAWPSLAHLTTGSASTPAPFPYVPGYLAFREAPALVAAFCSLGEQRPDLLFVDGQGIAHPRGFGIASHLGVLLDLPTIGVAKSILVGAPATAVGPVAGDRAPLVWKGMTVGMALRTRQGAQPLYVSIGHRISLETAVDLVLAACRGYRLPEPTRLAHLAANARRRALD